MLCLFPLPSVANGTVSVGGLLDARAHILLLIIDPDGIAQTCTPGSGMGDRMVYAKAKAAWNGDKGKASYMAYLIRNSDGDGPCAGRSGGIGI